jgi:deazaflavin-dependent oxidoreductase (nitroreductase family)
MPSDRFLKTMNGLHRALLTLTGGRLGASFGGMPTLELTTIGRRSGAPRSVLLTSPWQEGDTYAVVASRGGDDVHPAWFLNLRDNPAVRVRVVGQPERPMHARIATADERARIWPLITARYRNYAGYQERTSRQLPVVLLEPPAPGDAR